MYNKFLNQSYLMQTFIFLSFYLLRFYCRFTVALEDTVWLYYVSKNIIKLNTSLEVLARIRSKNTDWALDLRIVKTSNFKQRSGLWEPRLLGLTSISSLIDHWNWRSKTTLHLRLKWLKSVTYCGFKPDGALCRGYKLLQKHWRNPLLEEPDIIKQKT